MSETAEVLDLIARLTGNIDAQLSQLTDPEARQFLTVCRDLLRQSTQEFALLIEQLPTDKSVEKEIAENNAKRAPLLAEMNRRAASAAKVKEFSNADLIAKADQTLAELTAGADQRLPPMTPDFIPPLRESLLQRLGYLGNGAPTSPVGPSMAQWAMESASLIGAGQPTAIRDSSSNELVELADGLDERRAIWWACLALADVAARKGTPIAADLEEQIAQCCQWVLNPQSPKPKVVEPHENIETQGEPTALLSLALHFAGGEMSRFESVVPGPRRSQRCAASAVVRALEANPKANDSECRVAAVKIGSEVARGLRLWPSLSPEEVEKQSAHGRSSLESWLNASLGCERK